MTKPKHVPLRRCVVCREALPQKELLRLTQRENAWQFDLKRKAGGRGAWLCLKEKCHEVKQLKRFFRNDAEHIAREVAMIKAALGDSFSVTEVHANQLEQGRTLGGTHVR